mgnify:CR=1 FL=1
MIASRPGTSRERLYASTTDTFDGDLDYIAIEHAMNGEPVNLSLAERIETARQLATRGIGFTEIGRVPEGFRHPTEGLVDLLILHRKL